MVSEVLGAAASGGGSGSSFDFTPLLVTLGPFSVTAAALIWHIRDLHAQRAAKDQVIVDKDAIIAKQNADMKEVMNLVLPALAEGRDTVRENTRTMADATRAMEGLVNVSGRIPETTEIALLRHLLARKGD